jgi:hypothetical protein
MDPADRLLAAIALPVVAAAAVAGLSPISWATAMAAGSLPAGGTIGYALFEYRAGLS